MQESPRSRLPKRIRVVEVGPRDGFQMEEKFIPTELKIQTIDALSASGIDDIEAVSFVHPRVIPQMRDAAEVMQGIDRRTGVRYSALVPNLRGAERALIADVDAIHLVVCCSETYNQRNVGMSVAESLADLERIADVVAAKVPVVATLAATFGCPFEGQLPDSRILELARRLVDAGAVQLGLADSAGLGDPLLVGRIVGKVQQSLPGVPLRMHLHDTRGLGLANALVALELGVDAFDTSLGGLGGCPMMQGASGNIATEDFVNLCHEMELDTGVDIAAVRSAAGAVQEFLGRDLPGRILHSGTREELYARNREQC